MTRSTCRRSYRPRGCRTLAARLSGAIPPLIPAQKTEDKLSRRMAQDKRTFIKGRLSARIRPFSEAVNTTPQGGALPHSDPLGLSKGMGAVAPARDGPG